MTGLAIEKLDCDLNNVSKKVRRTSKVSHFSIKCVISTILKAKKSFSLRESAVAQASWLGGGNKKIFLAISDFFSLTSQRKLISNPVYNEALKKVKLVKAQKAATALISSETSTTSLASRAIFLSQSVQTYKASIASKATKTRTSKASKTAKCTKAYNFIAFKVPKSARVIQARVTKVSNNTEVAEALEALEALNAATSRIYKALYKATYKDHKKLNPVTYPLQAKTVYKATCNAIFKSTKTVVEKKAIALKGPTFLCIILRILGFRHTSHLKKAHLINSHDVEENPGPEDERISGGRREQELNSSILVTSYNVRGLNDEKKLRHLINYMSTKNKGKNVDFIACLQETYISNPGKLPYLWRGNYVITPGNGNSCGCVTLLSAHINVVSSISIMDRAHIIACQKAGENGVSFIVANIYAPNPNNAAKIDFFEEVLDKVHEYEELFDCTNSMVIGDFNLVFDAQEVKNRNYSSQERRVASVVKNILKGTQLVDIWETKRGFTWRRANSDSFSTIDRILYSKSSLKLGGVVENWSLSCSDHAALEVGFDLVRQAPQRRMRIARIEPSIIKSPELANQLTVGVNDLMRDVPGHWDPHMKLEFLKVSIRTVAEKVQADRNKKEKTEEQEINEELNSCINVLSRGSLSTDRKEQLISYVEELRGRKGLLVEEKGARLAERLGTKWYNEGEKSTRYFLRLLNRSMPDDFKEVVLEDGSKIGDQEGIKEEIVKFYKDLYESGGQLEETDDPTFFNKIPSIPGADEAKVVQRLTVEELRETLHTCKDSSPGPDGIPYSIIGHLWPIFGSILCDAWNHSLVTNTLAASHRASYLKLIPKAGKDLNKLTNWRPITLSNCDHKLITKAYAKRLCESVAPSINGCQTAYIKSRLINDNIRAINGTINLTNLEENTKGLLISLDAKKAFDSVSHKYIERCLQSFGCGRFIPIFRTLYSKLTTDIIINGQIVKGFNIARGVKQGDALSCILFIMCMEPLLRNIESNPEITPIFSTTLNRSLPKAYAYADDVNACINNSIDSARLVFKEYERLSKLSGLELNADKTELMQMGFNDENASYEIQYLSKDYKLKASQKVKINGVIFQSDQTRMVEENLENVIARIDKQCKKWSRRSLSTLGKILIMKTFGISQAIFLMQSVVLNAEHFKKLNATIYKFIWNKNYLAAKAPERIKREIINTPVKLGGFGMLDIVKLDESLKIKALGRILTTVHPFMLLIKEGLTFESYFNPQDCLKIDGISRKGIELLRTDRNRLWEIGSLDRDRMLLKVIGDTEIKEILNEHGANSIPFYILWRSGARKIKDLNLHQLGTIRRYIRPDKQKKVEDAVTSRSFNADAHFLISYYVNLKARPLAKLTSKDIREARSSKVAIGNFKIGMVLENSEALTWGLRLARVNSTRHKNIILRVAHGEIYTKEKLHRFGLTDSPVCPRCQETETLEHKFIQCNYIKRIWDIVLSSCRKITTGNPSTEPRNKAICGGYLTSNTTIITINAEIMLRILSLKDDESFLIHPKHFVKHAISYLMRKERKQNIKNDLKSIHELFEE